MSSASGWCSQRGIPNHHGCRVPESCGCSCHQACGANLAGVGSGADNWPQDTTTRVGPGHTVLEHQPGASPTDKDTTDS
jgi:hypothetical protein